MSETLDRIDRRLLRLLQENGRMPNAELAQKVNVSAATCHRRIQRLTTAGYIRNIRAQLEPSHLDLATLAIVGVVLDRSTTDSFATFEQAVSEMPAVLDCYLVAGDFDYFLKIRMKDMADFNRFHARGLLALPGVRQTRTFFVMKEVVDGGPLDI